MARRAVLVVVATAALAALMGCRAEEGLLPTGDVATPPVDSVAGGATNAEATDGGGDGAVAAGDRGSHEHAPTDDGASAGAVPPVTGVGRDNVPTTDDVHVDATAPPAHAELAATSGSAAIDHSGTQQPEGSAAADVAAGDVGGGAVHVMEAGAAVSDDVKPQQQEQEQEGQQLPPQQQEELPPPLHEPPPPQQQEETQQQQQPTTSETPSAPPAPEAPPAPPAHDTQVEVPVASSADSNNEAAVEPPVAASPPAPPQEEPASARATAYPGAAVAPDASTEPALTEMPSPPAAPAAAAPPAAAAAAPPVAVVSPLEAQTRALLTREWEERQAAKKARAAAAARAAARESSEFMCRACGATVTHGRDHLEDVRLRSARVVGTRHERELGAQGTVHEMTRHAGHPSSQQFLQGQQEQQATAGDSASSSTATTAAATTLALFADPYPPDGSGGSGTPPAGTSSPLVYGTLNEGQAVPGYDQQPVTCGKCGGLLGWRFLRHGLSAAPSAHQQQVAAEAAAARQSAAAAAGGKNAAPVASVRVGGGAGGDAPPAQQQLTALPFVEGGEGDALLDAAFEGVAGGTPAAVPGGDAAGCVEFPAGYWSYLLCHKREVRQFHRGPQGEAAPNWSLGAYEGSHAVERPSGVVTARGSYYTSHFYRGGQRCDETGKGRATEVQFLCCGASAPLSHVKRRGAAAAEPKPTPAPPFIASIDEPALCKYRLSVCVPALCTAAPSPSPAAAAAAAAAAAEQAEEEGAEEGGAEEAHGATAAPVPSAAAPAAEAPPATPTADATPAASRPLMPAASSSPTPPSDLPPSFLALLWASLLGDGSPGYAALAAGGYATGTMPVRFG